MRVCVTVEQRFDRTPDGTVWTPAQFPYTFWLGYIRGFDAVRVIARVRDVPSVPADWLRANGEQVEVAAVPHYHGPKQYLLKLLAVQRAVRAAITPTDAVILRVGSPLATCAMQYLLRKGHPYGVEVVADPHDAFGPKAIRHPLQPFLQRWGVYNLRHQCAHARAGVYVTRTALQRRYPCYGPTWAATDTNLWAESFVAQPRSADSFGAPLRLITVASLAQLYKGVDLLIDAVAQSVRAGLDLVLTIVGDGNYRPELEQRAARLGIAERVRFRGQVASGAAVRAELDQADLFVLASRAEGLPRAMVEAMARALPCLGSTVGGIPELLPADDLVPPEDVPALARAIGAVAANPARLAAMSARNLREANDYRAESVAVRQVAFLQYLRDVTTQWQSSHAGWPRQASS